MALSFIITIIFVIKLNERANDNNWKSINDLKGTHPPEDLKSLEYNLFIFPKLNQNSFTGNVSINILVMNKTK